MAEVFIVQNVSTNDIELKDFGAILTPSEISELEEFDKAVLSTELSSYITSGDLIRLIDGTRRFFK